MAAFTSKASGDWNTDGQASWNEAGHPVAGDTVTLGHNMTAKASVACATVVSSTPGTNRTLTFNDTGNVLAGVVIICAFSGITTDLSIVVNGHCLAPADALSTTTTTTYFTVTGDRSTNYPKGTFITVDAVDAGNDGTKVCSADALYTGGVTRIYVASLIAQAADSGTIRRWLPVAITALGDPGLSTGTSDAITVNATGCASISGTAGVDVVRASTGKGINNAGYITTVTGNQTITGEAGMPVWNVAGGTILSLTGNQTAGTGDSDGINNKGYIGTIIGNQTCTIASAIYNEGIIDAITGNQTTTSGQALRCQNGGTIGTVIGNQTGTNGGCAGVDLRDSACVIDRIEGNQTGLGASSYGISNSGTINTIIGNQECDSGKAIYNAVGAIGTVTGNQKSTTGQAVNNQANSTITTINGDQETTSGTALYNIGTIGTVNGDQTATTGKAINFDGGTIGTINGNQSNTDPTAAVPVVTLYGAITELNGDVTNVGASAGVKLIGSGGKIGTWNGDCIQNGSHDTTSVGVWLVATTNYITTWNGDCILSRGYGIQGDHGYITTWNGIFILQPITGAVAVQPIALVNSHSGGNFTITNRMTAAAWLGPLGGTDWRFKTAALAQVTATGVALDSTVAKDATVSKPGTAQTITPPITMALAGEAAAASSKGEAAAALAANLVLAKLDSIVEVVP